MYSDTQGAFADPEKISSHLHLCEGDTVIDLGAGSGNYMEPLSKAVGKSGRVYLGDVQKTLVDTLDNRAQELHLSNIRPLWCDIETVGGIKLKDESLDAALLSNTLFQIENKDNAATEIYRVLHKGGKLFVVDWTESFGGLGPHKDHVITQEVAKALFEKNGFSYEGDFPAGDHHYGIALRKV